MEDEADFAIAVQPEDDTITIDSGYVTCESLSYLDGQPDGDDRGLPPPDDQHLPQQNIPHQVPQIHQQPHQPQPQNLNPNRYDSGEPNLSDNFVMHVKRPFEQDN